jgi:putative flippase GtrA
LLSYRKLLTDARLLQLLRFVVVGGTTFVIYFGLQFLLEWARLGPYVALTIAYAIAITYHFLMNRYFTFRSSATDGGISAILPRYASVVLLSYVISVIVVKAVMSAGFHIQVGMLAALGLTTILTYVFAKVWIFRAARRGRRAPETVK